MLAVFGIWASYSSYNEIIYVNKLKKKLSAEPNLSWLIKNDASILYKNISDIFSEQNLLTSSSQKYAVLKRDKNTLYLGIDYDMQINSNFLTIISLLEKLEAKRLVHSVQEFGIEKKSDKNDELGIQFKFKAIVYDKIS